LSYNLKQENFQLLQTISFGEKKAVLLEQKLLQQKNAFLGVL